MESTESTDQGVSQRGGLSREDMKYTISRLFSEASHRVISALVFLMTVVYLMIDISLSRIGVAAVAMIYPIFVYGPMVSRRFEMFLHPKQ